ncbi:MAG: hypothetical protein OYL97_07275 [Candidatus Poribacteria bacterium]|nr:hypothetical protein [Candidatus Poribacteria bacterium]
MQKVCWTSPNRNSPLAGFRFPKWEAKGRGQHLPMSRDAKSAHHAQKQICELMLGKITLTLT